MNEEKFKWRKLIGNKGITLVALIITIVVLLILAMAAIGAIRDSKIITHAQNAGSSYTIAQEKEQIGLAVDEWKIQKAIPGNTQSFYDVVKAALNGTADVTDNGNGTLTVTFNKTVNVYIVDDNGNITKQGDDKDEDDDKVTGDFEITVEQSPNGSPVSSVTLTIRPTIPDSWKKTEFTEEEAVETVNGATLQIPNITSLEDFDKELYNFLNDMPGTPISGEADVGDYNSLKTVMSSKITLGEDPENEIFSYLMSLAGLNYSTVYAAATDMYQYEPSDHNVKIRKISGEWLDITNKSNWNTTTYEVDKNGTYEIQMQLDDKNSSTKIEVTNCSNLGKYVKFDADKDASVEDETILWRVLRDDDNKVELITADVLGNVDLTSTDFNDARKKYNNAVDLMVAECKRVTGIESNIRSIGGSAVDTTDTVVFANLDTFQPKEGVDFSQYETTEQNPENGLKIGDNNYEDDWNQMQKAGVGQSDNSQEYWLASRIFNEETDNVSFNVMLGTAWNEYGSTLLCGFIDDGTAVFWDITSSRGVRPVLTLEPGVLDNTTQSGTKDDPIEIYQK